MNQDYVDRNKTTESPLKVAEIKKIVISINTISEHINMYTTVLRPRGFG